MVNNTTTTVDAVQSGSWTVTANAGTGFPAVATAGSASPTTGIMAMGHDGTNAQRLRTDTNGRLSVDINSGGSTGSSTPADNFATPTTATLNQTFNMVYDGATWDMLRGNSAGGAFIQGPAAAGAAIAGNPVLAGGSDGTLARALKTDAAGELQIDILSIAAGDNNIGNVDIASGTLTANAGTGFPAVATAGSAHITTGLQTMISDGTNAVRMKGDAAGSTFVRGATVSALLNQDTITVTTTATQLLASNANRKGFVICNNGSVTMYVGDASVLSGATAQAEGGFRVNANGGSFSNDQMAGYTGALFGITAATTTIAAATEW